MPNLVAISQATTEINRGVESTPPPKALSVSNHPGEIGLRHSRNEIRNFRYLSLKMTSVIDIRNILGSGGKKWFLDSKGLLYLKGCQLLTYPFYIQWTL